MDEFDSTSDERATKNVMRHQYRPLSEEEKEMMAAVKDRGLDLFELIESIEARDCHSRELALAKTKVEEAVMWAVKHLTG